MKKRTFAEGGVIPTESPYKAPPSTGEDTSGPSNIDRVLLGMGVGAAGIGAGAKLRQMKRAKDAAKADDFAWLETLAGRSAPQGANPKTVREAELLRSAMQRRNAASKNTTSSAADKEQSFSRLMDRLDKEGLAKGGKVKGYAKGGVTRADGCAQRGKTKGRYI